MKVVMILTSHDALGETGMKTGVWLEEFAAPYYELVDSGVDVTLASPLGGPVPIDPGSDRHEAQTSATKRFHADATAQELLAETLRLDQVHAYEFDGVFLPGGHGLMWDLVDNERCLQLLSDFVASNKPLGAVCHAPITLKNVRTPEGVFYLEGRNVTGFSNAEEWDLGLADVVPELVEDVLVHRGANYSKGPHTFAPYIVVDGLLVTGQNPASSSATAITFFELLDEFVSTIDQL